MKYAFIVEYDGTPFCGWQRQSGVLSVQEVLENALKIALRHEVVVFGSGRTDTGVHAWGQVAHFESPYAVDAFKLRDSLNALVRPHPIAVHQVFAVPDTFHARFSARERFYTYLIQNTRFPPALERNRMWHIAVPLDAEKMNQAAQLLIGKHDFSTFRATECQAKSPVKTLNHIAVRRDGDKITVSVSARSFLHHQVRNMVGSLALVGRGKWTVQAFKEAFDACDRTKGGPTAPARGLYFERVVY